MSKRENKIKGNLGEDIACRYLEKNDYKILKRNFTSYRGEIDIVAFDKDEIVFVEVKTRTQVYCGMPSESVDCSKKKQLYKVAEYYLYLNRICDSRIRFDVIEIYLYGTDSYRLNHIKNAILDSPYDDY